MTSRLSLIVPALLTWAFTWIWFNPSLSQMPGWGEDPIFVLGVFEHLWSKLLTGDWRNLGAFPIFWPFGQALYLSESFILPAVFSFPLYWASGESVLTLCLFAWVIQAVNFSSMVLWLRSIGLDKSAGWGGFLFATSPWLQEHYAHYQNLFIFVLPLALWSVRMFIKRPKPMNLLIAGIFVGWVGGWNLYFQIFTNICVAAYVLWCWRKRELGLIGSLSLFLVIGLIEFVLLKPYLDVTAFLGSYAVTTGEVLNYSAHWNSFLAHAQQMSLIEWIPFYPGIKTSIESVGFVGFLPVLTLFWILLKFRKTTEIRWAAIAAFFAYVVSLGPVTPFYGILNLFPGFGALRAIGRVQMVFVFFLIPVLLFAAKVLLKQNPRLRLMLISLFFLEWIPGNKGLVVPAQSIGEIHSGFTNAKSPWVLKSSRFVSVQREWNRLGLFLSNGYSGRSPLHVELFEQSNHLQSDFHSWVNHSKRFLGAKSFLLDQADWILLAEKDPGLRSLGCQDIAGSRHCGFEILDDSHSKGVEIERTPFEKVILKSEETFLFRSTDAGGLSLDSVWGCQVRETYRWNDQYLFSKKMSLRPWGFAVGNLEKGEVVLRLARVRPLILRGNALKRDAHLECSENSEKMDLRRRNI